MDSIKLSQLIKILIDTLADDGDEKVYDFYINTDSQIIRSEQGLKLKRQ